MGMLTSMYAGVAGLNAFSKALSAVADNVANMSTYGYKSNRVNFGDIMVQSLASGGSTSNQVGMGSRVLSVQSMLTSGSFETTDVSTDMAINGKGFFAVRQVNTAAVGSTSSTSTNVYYTRAGNFLMDKEGYLVNPEGLRLQGYNIDSSGNLSSLNEDLRIVTQQTAAVPTSKLDMSLNLDASDTTTFAHTTGIDPSDSSTYNYTTSSKVYDSLGVAHNLTFYFQKLSDSPTVTPDGTSSVWRVAMYENNDGTLTPSPSGRPDNTFYMCFDTDGKLVGTVDYFNGSPATADSYSSSASVADSATTVLSTKIGETLSYTGSGSQQTYETSQTLTYNAAFAGTETITIGSKTYTVSGALSAAAGAQDLAEQINADTGSDTNYYAVVDTTGANPVIRLYAQSGSTYTVSATGANLSGGPVSSSYTMDDVINAINGTGSEAEGSLLLTGNSDGSISINGTTVTWTANVGGTAATLADIANSINTNAILSPLVTARVDGNQVIITANNEGSQYEYTLAGSGANTVVPDSKLHGGLADSAASGVTATTYLNTNGSTSLELLRTATGATQTITLASSNSLGASQGFNFSKWTQLSYASNAEGTPTADTTGKRTFSFSFSGATPNQSIAIDFKPDSSSSSTSTAGDSETYYLYQDGAPSGTLQSLSIDKDGLITGQFSNGIVQTLGAVTLTNFYNPEALQREGSNLYSATLAAGSPIVSRPGQAGTGDVESGSLEQSNVDLATELVKMINYQRAFQANSKAISTTDDMLAELIQLKR